MKTVIVPAVCFVIGTACGALLISQKSRSDSTADAGRRGESSTLGSAIPGSDSAGGASSSGSGDGAGAPAERGSSPGGPVSAADLLKLASRSQTPGSMIEIYRATEHLDSGALLRLAQEIDQIPPNDQRSWQLRSIVMARFAEVDPDAALAHARSISNRNIRQQALGMVVGEIANRDLSMAATILRGIEDRSEFQQVAGAIANSSLDGAPELLLTLLKEREGVNLEWGYNNMFAHWARKDLQAAITNLDQIPAGQQRNYALQGIGNAISGENLEAGLEFLRSLPNRAEKSQMLGSILGTLASSDPQRALALLEEHGDQGQRPNQLAMIASSWINTDPEGARAWIDSLDNPRDRASALQHLVYSVGSETDWLAAQIASLPPNHQTQNLVSNLAQQWGQSDPEAAAAWINTLPGGQARQNARQNLMSNWAQSDPAAAAAFFSQEPIGPNEGYAAGQIVGQWIKTDPGAALEWMDSLDTTERMRSQMIGSMVGNWAQSDPKAAAAFALGLEGKEKDQAISSLVGTWSGTDFAGAEAWVAGIGDQGTRNQALNSLISSSAYNDPQRAAAALDNAIAGLSTEEISKTFGSAASSIANGWAQSDPVAAATWAVELPDPKTRPQLLQGIVQQWARYEPQAASQWLTTFEGGPDRDAAIGGLLDTIQRDDPEAAFAWAATIDNENSRNSYVQQAVNQWKNSDPDAARAAIIQSADLSDELRASLLNGIRD